MLGNFARALRIRARGSRREKMGLKLVSLFHYHTFLRPCGKGTNEIKLENSVGGLYINKIQRRNPLTSCMLQRNETEMDQLEFIDTKVLNRSIEEPLGVDLGAMVPGNREAFTRFVSAFYGIICVVGLAGNLMVAVVLLRVRTLRSNTSDFLVHLSAVDFMVCILVIPTNLVPAPSPTPNPGLWGEFWCRFFMSGFVFWFFTVNSVFSLIAVNLERYVAIVHPHKYKTVFTKRNKYIMIATCWILAVVTHSFHFFVFDELDVVGCQRLGWRNLFARSAYGLYNFTINLLIPLAVMVFAQLRVISTLNTQVKMLTARAGKLFTFFISRCFIGVDYLSWIVSTRKKIIVQRVLTHYGS